MVFLKFKREDDTWQWRFDLTEVTAVGKGDPEYFDERAYNATVGEYLNDGEGNPYILVATINDKDTRAFYFYPKEAYLCDQRSGSTVEILH